MSSINLQSPEVVIREIRLGSITGYQGNIGKLVKESRGGVTDGSIAEKGVVLYDGSLLQGERNSRHGHLPDRLRRAERGDSAKFADRSKRTKQLSELPKRETYKYGKVNIPALNGSLCQAPIYIAYPAEGHS